MKGDFSHWKFDPRDNHAGVLQQQGRVLIDRDWNAQVRIETDRADVTARHTFGARVAAVPADRAGGFQVTGVGVGTGADGDERVELTLTPGRLWADGIPVVLSTDENTDPGELLRVADYLRHPVQSPGGTIGSIEPGVRDVVVLEVTREALNGFQQPSRLIEPALGGPDTTERMHTRAAFRLYRLNGDQDCRSIIPDLCDDPANRGRLTVRLQPTIEVPGDCPVVAGGGYTGFEHHLYRIEVAQLPDGDPLHFKWSQFNGGLVGRGRLETTPDRIVITANNSAILNSGLNAFYAEIIQWDEERGRWRVTFGADVSLSDGALHISDVRFGTLSATSGTVFFRLWNGIRAVGDFDDPEELLDGIQLSFAPAAIANLRPDDYWTFQVRAGEIENAELLIDDAPPDGPHYHRVPLAELTWDDPGVVVVPPALEDCRRRFRPLTNQTVCCTLLVGDGIRSFGDFNCLAEAAAHLPSGGGELCLLPGIHFANVTLTDRSNVRIHGCRDRTWVFPRPSEPDRPVITVQGGFNLSVEDVQLVSFEGMCVRLEASQDGVPREVGIHRTKMLGRTHAVRVTGGKDIRITENTLHVWDTDEGGAVVSLRAEDTHIAHNRLIVRPGTGIPEDDRDDGDQGGGGNPTPEDPCATPEDLYGQLSAVPHFIANIWMVASLLPPAQPYRAQGGLHIRGGSTTTRVHYNRIAGGSSHGITLGGTLRGDPAAIVEDTDEEGNVVAPRIPVNASTDFVIHTVSAEDGSRIGNVPIFLTEGPASFTGRTDDEGFLVSRRPTGLYRVSTGAEYAIEEMDAGALGSFAAASVPLYTLRLRPAAANPAAAFIHDLEIDHNEISRMGLSGIGFTLLQGTEAAATGTAMLNALSQVEDADDPATVATVMLATMLSPRELVGTTNPVRGLRITRNTIPGNVLNPFTEAMLTAARRIAIGGISLGIVEQVSIAENNVRENGPNAIDPVCGIFIAHGDDVDICNNTLADNGVVDDTADYRDRRAQGLRSGIFVRFAGATAIARGSRKPALRVQNNRIDQPAGRALTAFAFGPVSCEGNFLNSEHTGNWNFYDDVVGGVLILNFGGLHRALNTPEQDASDTDHNTNPDASGQMRRGIGIDAKEFRNQQVVESVLPGGEVLYNSNQVRLGARHTAYTSQVVLSLDDLGYDANQSSLFGQSLLFANTILVARTLRATDSRFTEDLSAAVQQGTISLLSNGFIANTTVHNQADNCIVALPHPDGGPLSTIASPNQVLNASFCGRFLDTRGILAYAVGFLFMVQARDAQNLTDARISAEADELGHLTANGGQQAVLQLEGGNAEVHQVYQYEQVYLTQNYGEADVRALEMEQTVTRQRHALDLLDGERELVNIALSDARVPIDSMHTPTTEGRVTTPGAGARADMRVEYVDSRGEPLGPSATTDENGFYSFQLAEEEAESLSGREDVFVRVLDPSGGEIQRSSAPIDPVQALRVNFEVARPAINPDAVSIGEPVFVQPVRETGRASPEARDPQPPPSPPPPDDDPDSPPDGPESPPSPPNDPEPPPPAPSPTARERQPEPPSEPRPQPGRRPQPRRRPIHSRDPGHEDRPTTSTPLESIRGIGPVRANELRRRGIHDVETLLRTPAARITGVPGFAIESAKETGERILEQRPGPDRPSNPNNPER